MLLSRSPVRDVHHCQCPQINYSHFLCYFHLKRRNQHPVFIIFTRQFFHQIRSVRKRSSCIIRSSFPKPDPIFTCLPLIRVDGMWIPVRTGRSLPVLSVRITWFSPVACDVIRNGISASLFKVLSAAFTSFKSPRMSFSFISTGFHIFRAL